MFDVGHRSGGASIYLATSNDQMHPPEKMIDGSEKTFWTSTGLYPQEFIMGFGHMMDIQRVNLSSYNIRHIEVEKCTTQDPTSFEPLVEKVICLGIEVLFFIQKLEKLEADYTTISACNIQDCEWTEWGKWGACSSTCDSGLRSRTRSCSNKISSSSSSSPKVLSSDGGNIQYEPCYEKKCPPVISVFSASDPKALSSPESLYQLRQYSTVHINEGEDFNPSTGIFTCSKPGVYYFTATLVKKRADVRVDLVHCYIYKNTSQQLLLYVDPTDDDTDKGHAAISNSVVLRLDRHDIVYLGWCDDPSTSIEGWSSFSGFILYPD